MAADPSLRSSSGSPIPQLAFGLYKVPADEEGERIIRNAVKVRSCDDSRQSILIPDFSPTRRATVTSTRRRTTETRGRSAGP